MANIGSVTVEISVVGSAVPVMNALSALKDALDTHGHVWTEDELAQLELAVDLCEHAGLSPTIVLPTTIDPMGSG